MTGALHGDLHRVLRASADEFAQYDIYEGCR